MTLLYKLYNGHCMVYTFIYFPCICIDTHSSLCVCIHIYFNNYEGQKITHCFKDSFVWFFFFENKNKPELGMKLGLALWLYNNHYGRAEEPALLSLNSPKLKNTQVWQ